MKIESHKQASEVSAALKNYHLSYVEEQVRLAGSWENLGLKLGVNSSTLYKIWKRASLSPIIRLSNKIYEVLDKPTK
ncbi:hypothetical protein DQM68_19560 (plasmid) [Leptospira mayottensis]|uniref:Uncharacterized protein n=1 Tax=Leptospira mayottensis 200901116 TaxID=1192864 RepID=A0A343US47_9LEPT|nr:hypothetical protein [Leptospira mayottensis 200901116]AXR62866.1 hypothetical protein DQM68_19560 [Leptospira mayottensis]